MCVSICSSMLPCCMPTAYSCRLQHDCQIAPIHEKCAESMACSACPAIPDSLPGQQLHQEHNCHPCAQTVSLGLGSVLCRTHTRQSQLQGHQPYTHQPAHLWIGKGPPRTIIHSPVSAAACVDPCTCKPGSMLCKHCTTNGAMLTKDTTELVSAAGMLYGVHASCSNHNASRL
jgi:hypothetical protein